ncbi:hypothetical protein CDL12_23078 [Handroanthus impetiginosus]|uniref:Small auxin-up RNA n=1 Tax=Handroanthus impetiginosus TaxID=429701 RepID=A0A2G9GGH6_9LAMI|nr:hypothetical protein CDL12_23078 [Handroanthus impetiginosus]
MGKTGGFKLGTVKVLKCCLRRRTRLTPTYKWLQPPSSMAGPTSKLSKWVLSLRRGAGRLCSGRSNSGYIRAGRNPFEQTKLPEGVPKGHLAVYVGDKEDDTCRVLVPVLYFNHPLFGELLKEAEKVYGFNHPGGIQIPCSKSELENVQLKIAASSGGGSWRRK